MDNVWVLFTGEIEHRELVRGPFADLTITPDAISHHLTGETIAIRTDDGRWWSQGKKEWMPRVWQRIVVQAGGFESPWGDRGPIVGPA